MKKEITLTAVPIMTTEAFRPFLDAFEAESGIHVHLEIFEWSTYRSQFVNRALQHKVGEVALAGTPATSDLISMNVLRPFSLSELASFGGQSAFLPARWQSGMRPGSAEVWAIPMVLDIRMIYYWRDLLASAGVDETTAFQDPRSIEQTFQKLSEQGSVSAWAILNDRHFIMHTAASLIWAHGSDLFSADGKKVTFHEAQGLEGIHAYFKLLQYANPETITRFEVNDFLKREAAVVVSNGWAVNTSLPEELGCAPLPGGSYIGGSDLMIWSNTRNETEALKLVQYLTRPDVQEHICRVSGNLPPRLSGLTELASHPSPLLRTMGRAGLTGRTFPCVPMVGLVEDRLSTLLFAIQQEVLANPGMETEAALQKQLTQLGNRINVSLGN